MLIFYNIIWLFFKKKTYVDLLFQIWSSAHMAVSWENDFQNDDG